LHNISISSQEVEQVEREDESASFNKPVKIKGKAKPRKVMELETKPSPMGRRVVPRIDSTMKNKVHAAAAKKARDKVHCNSRIRFYFVGIQHEPLLIPS
jgi:hypothetical protein